MPQISISIKSLITKNFSAGIFSIMFVTLCVFGQTKTPRDIRPLTAEKAIERELKSGEQHSYDIALTPGQYLEAIVEQKGIGIVVTLFDSSNKSLAEVDSSSGGMQGPKPLLFIADTAGKYRLEVRSFEKTAPAGRYEIKLKELRTVMEKDKKCFDAQQAFYEAEKLHKQETPESLQSASKKYDEALILYRAAEDRENEASTLTNIGVVYSYLGVNDKSLDYLQKALQLSREIKYKRGEAIARYELGWYYSVLEENQKSLEYFAQAFSLFDANRDGIVKTASLFKMGSASRLLGDNQKAKQYFLEALSLFKLAGNKDLEAVTLNDLSLVYQNLGRYENALNYLKLSLELKKDATRKSEEAIREAVGEKREEAVKKAVKNKKEEAITINNIGLTYTLLGDYQKAIDYFTQALPVEEGKDKAAAISNIAYSYFQLGKNQKAFEYSAQALSIYKDIKDKSGEGRTLSFIGEVNYKIKDNQKAIKFYTEGLQLIQISGDKIGEAWTLASIGIFYSNSGENQKALDYLNQAMTIQTAVGDIRGKARTLNQLQAVWLSLSNPRQAILYGKQSVNAYQEVRGEIKGLDKDLQFTFVKTVEPTYRSLADILISEGRLLEAQAVLDLLKEEEFGKIDRKSGAQLLTLPYTRAEEETIKTIDRTAALAREYSELKAKPRETLTPEEIKQLDYLERVEIPAANRAARLALEALSKASPDVKKLFDDKLEENIQTTLPALGRGVVALYTVVGKTGAEENVPGKTGSKGSGEVLDKNKVNFGWIVLVTPEDRRAFPIDTKDLEQTVFKFRAALRSIDSNVQPLYQTQPIAEELYKKLFLQTSEKQTTTLAAYLDEYLSKQSNKTLMWSLDGVLRYVPMAALHDGKGYLIEKYRNVVFNKASLGSLKDLPKPTWEVVGLGVSTAQTLKAPNGKALPFPALKDSEIELNSLVKEKDGKDTEGIFPGTVQINNAFTKDALFNGARARIPVIHISSHFWFNPAQQETSFLLLGNGDRLEMSEFEDYPTLFSDVDFLSLSACDTATGSASINPDETDKRESNGKEVEGFAWEAQKRGAKSVMASLWEVSATGTKELMLKFYQIKKEQPDLSKAEVLRQAQLSLLRGTDKTLETTSREKGVEEQRKKSVEGLKPFTRDKKVPFAHPYYWSSFILIGNWR
jgi:CHAT domain-containing protein/Tfp pilus assembly protein PilF